MFVVYIPMQAMTPLSYQSTERILTGDLVGCSLVHVWKLGYKSQLADEKSEDFFHKL